MDKIQIFRLTLDELQINALVNILMKEPAGNVYSLLRDLESQTTKQRNLPDNNKLWKSFDEKKEAV